VKGDDHVNNVDKFIPRKRIKSSFRKCGSHGSLKYFARSCALQPERKEDGTLDMRRKAAVEWLASKAAA
jgi:hypothetical protein